MGRRTSYPIGTPCWVSLGTTDPESARRFYGEVLGWSGRDVPEIDSTLFELDGAAVAGLQATSGPPAWATYVCVDDADAAAARATELGGTVSAAPVQIAGHGRRAVIADPLGGVIVLWQPGAFAGAELVNGEGAWAWGDLQTPDPEASMPFYASLFGWEFAAIEASQGLYWTITSGGRAIGGVMRSEQVPQPFWAAYFGVPDLDGALAAIVAAGGSQLAGPIPVPTGRFAIVRDPQGAVFGVLEGSYDD